MFKCQNGFTREKMKEVIKLKNNGTPPVDAVNFSCLYQDGNGNRCVVGCFFPDNHPALKSIGWIVNVLQRYGDLRSSLPLDDDGMQKLQGVHDGYAHTKEGLRKNTLHEVLFKWIDENVEDV